MAKPLKNRLVVLVALLLLTLAFFLFQQATGLRINLFAFGDRERDLAEGNMHQAVQSCRQRITQELGDTLLQMDTDERGTRYDQAQQQYQVIFDLVMRGAERDDFWAQCWVSSVTQEVIRYHVNSPPGQFEGIKF